MCQHIPKKVPLSSIFQVTSGARLRHRTGLRSSPRGRPPQRFGLSSDFATTVFRPPPGTRWNVSPGSGTIRDKGEGPGAPFQKHPVSEPQPPEKASPRGIRGGSSVSRRSLGPAEDLSGLQAVRRRPQGHAAMPHLKDHLGGGQLRRVQQERKAAKIRGWMGNKVDNACRNMFCNELLLI